MVLNNNTVDMAIIAKQVSGISEAKQRILRDAPSGWFRLDDLPWADNVRLGVHMAQLRQAGLTTCPNDPPGHPYRRYGLTDAGIIAQRYLRAMQVEP